MRPLAWLLLTLPLLAAPPTPIKVVVVTMFERGADTGDQPGEFQYWVEREELDRTLPFPHGWRDLRMNREGVLAICTGVGTARAAASIMALGLDPRFDLRRAYWLAAGIAGIDPADGTLGDAVWAEWVLDGDLAHEIDAREIPKDWNTGMIPLRKSKPWELPRRLPDEGEVYRLDPQFVEWAFQRTKGIRLDDNDALRARRLQYTEAAARRAPAVIKGDTLSSGTYWHGRLMNEWANGWVRYHTEGRGSYVTTAMEDSGTLQSLTWLAKSGKVDRQRVLVLRTASNFDSQRPGISAAESLAETKVGSYTAYLPSLEAAHRVGSAVVRELVRGWKEYSVRMPGGGAK